MHIPCTFHCGAVPRRRGPSLRTAGAAWRRTAHSAYDEEPRRIGGGTEGSIEDDWTNEEAGESAAVRLRVLKEDAIPRAALGVVVERIKPTAAQRRQRARSGGGLELKLLAVGVDVPGSASGSHTGKQESLGANASMRPCRWRWRSHSPLHACLLHACLQHAPTCAQKAPWDAHHAKRHAHRSPQRGAKSMHMPTHA